MMHARLVLFLAILVIATATRAQSPFCASALGITVDGSSTHTNTQSIGDSIMLTDLDVTIDIDHVWIGDLDIAVSHDDTTTSVQLLTPMTDVGDTGSPGDCQSDGLDVTLDDKAGSSIQVSCAGDGSEVVGSFAPNSPLTAFDGEDVNGDWTMTVVDTYPAFSTGTWNEWCLETTPIPVELMEFSIN